MAGCAPLAKNSAAAAIFEGELHLGAIGGDLALFDDEILLDDLGDAQVTQRLRRPLDRHLGRLLPGFAAGADQLDDLVDAIDHLSLPGHGCAVSSGAGSGGGPAAAGSPAFPFGYAK